MDPGLARAFSFIAPSTFTRSDSAVTAEPEPAPEVSPSSTFTAAVGFNCQACTFLNTDSSLNRCSLCGTFRNTEEMSRAATASEKKQQEKALQTTAGGASWLCQQCTYINRRGRDTCKVCNVGTRAESEKAFAAAAASLVKPSSTTTAAASSAASSSASATSAVTPHRSKRRKATGREIAVDESDEAILADVTSDDTEMTDASASSASAASASSSPAPSAAAASTSASAPTDSRSKRAIVRVKRGAATAKTLAYPAPYVLPSPSAAFTAPFSGLSLSSPSAAAATPSSIPVHPHATVPTTTTRATRSRYTKKTAAAAAAASISASPSSMLLSPAPVAPAPSVTPIPSTPAKTSLIQYTVEDSREELTDEEAAPFYANFGVVAKIYSRNSKLSEESKEKENDDERESVIKILQSLYDDLKYNPSPSATATVSAPAASSASSSVASSSSSSSSIPASASLPLRAAQCTVCFADFAAADAMAEADQAIPACIKNCGHEQLCTDCFQQYVSIKVNEGAVMPWICCPTPNCRHPLTPSDLTDVAQLSTTQLAHLMYVYSQKRLVRNGCFVACQGKGCRYGFFILNHKNGKVPKAKKMTCDICQTEQTVEKGKEGELDDEFKKMITAGTLRPCPKCNHLTLKEKGLCNILNCAKCAVWWNWRTKETGKDSTTLKNKARAHGTLWEAGELDYQRTLERTNKKEFIALLARNGVAYDPHYVRGS